MPLLIAVAILLILLDILSRFFVFISPLMAIALFVTYMVMKKRGLFVKYQEGWKKYVMLAARIILIIYIIFNILLFLFCLNYLFIYPGTMLVR